jgi:hypothetical protein
VSLPYTKDTFKNLDPEFRIGAIISDGMWYSLPKWRKLARVTEPQINAWVEEKLASGELLQAPEGAKSYRFPLESIQAWYDANHLQLGQQLIDFIFPPRIWDNHTESEGFLDAPLREIGIVSFSASPAVAADVAEELRGIAKVREFEPSRYKAYCLNASHTKEIVERVLRASPNVDTIKTYSRSEAKRREIVDFSPKFARGLVMFYKAFGRTLVKKEMETIKIFLEDADDQDSQITIWVLTAIEKFDESASVPFSGYLNSVLKRWPYDLPSTHLGKDLSAFQRQRARAIDALKKKIGDERNFTNQELAEAMGLEQNNFADLEEKHRVWMRTRHATTLHWTENSDEKAIEANLSGSFADGPGASDVGLAHRLSLAILTTALATENYEDAFTLISQMDSSEINMSRIQTVSDSFIQELSINLAALGE